MYQSTPTREFVGPTAGWVAGVHPVCGLHRSVSVLCPPTFGVCLYNIPRHLRCPHTFGVCLKNIPSLIPWPICHPSCDKSLGRILRSRVLLSRKKRERKKKKKARVFASGDVSGSASEAGQSDGLQATEVESGQDGRFRHRAPSHAIRPPPSH